MLIVQLHSVSVPRFIRQLYPFQHTSGTIEKLIVLRSANVWLGIYNDFIFLYKYNILYANLFLSLSLSLSLSLCLSLSRSPSFLIGQQSFPLRWVSLNCHHLENIHRYTDKHTDKEAHPQTCSDCQTDTETDIFIPLDEQILI